LAAGSTAVCGQRQEPHFVITLRNNLLFRKDKNGDKKYYLSELPDKNEAAQAAKL